jgi:hypothetical protein
MYNILDARQAQVIGRIPLPHFAKHASRIATAGNIHKERVILKHIPAVCDDAHNILCGSFYHLFAINMRWSGNTGNLHIPHL